MKEFEIDDLRFKIEIIVFYEIIAMKYEKL